MKRLLCSDESTTNLDLTNIKYMSTSSSYEAKIIITRKDGFQFMLYYNDRVGDRDHDFDEICKRRFDV